MSLRRRAALPPSTDRALERIQRAHEVHAALEAARHLQACLEMLGDRSNDVRRVRRLRNALALDQECHLLLDEPPCQALSAGGTDGSSS